MQLHSSKSPDAVRSLVFDGNGICIAQAVYRCMICADVFDTLDDIQKHYRLEHYEHNEDEIHPYVQPNGDHTNHPEEVDYEDDNFNINKVSSQVQHFGQAQNHFPESGEEDSTGESNENFAPKSSILSGSHNGKGGYVTCEVCGLTKFYSHISRRYGVFSCESCAKFFYRYCQKPVQFYCANNNGCPLDIDLPGGRCKSCLLEACVKKYILDPKKHPKTFLKDSLINGNVCDESKVERTSLNELSDHADTSPAIQFEKSKQPKLSTRSSKTSNQSRQSSGKSSTQTKSASNSPAHLENKKTLSLIKKSADHDKSLPFTSINKKIRRGACRKCAGCLSEDCGKCLYCLDKPKFGGNDIKKQRCIRKRCQS